MPKGKSVSAETVENLLTAYNCERNASARYTAFAVQADKEHFFGVGSLFRAVAHSEQVHASNHARVLHMLGAELDLQVLPLQVKSASANLETAVQGELDEAQQMYPVFANCAREDGCREAVASLLAASGVEGEHAVLFNAALEGLDDYREKTEYFVCCVCGWLSAGKNFRKCKLCNTLRDNFDRIV